MFRLADRPTIVAPQPGGHIHDSWVVTCAGGTRYLLQRLNTVVFPDIAAVMRNVVRVTSHLRERSEPTVTVVLAQDGAPWWQGPDGSAWRAFEFVDGAATPSPVVSPSDAGAVGAAFGRFAGALTTLPAPALETTIPRFHDLRYRWEQLVAVGGGGGDEFEPFRYLVGRWEAAEARLAALPGRVAHNDAKASNVLLDRGSGELLAVIDLDTTMPGTILPDLGDLVRSAACPAAEDETDLARVSVDDALFADLVAGYAAGAGARITPGELSLVVLAAQCITFEQAVRFLTDHLAGDRYYRIARPGHNRDRARNQLRLLEDLVAREDHLMELAAGAIRD